MTLSIGTIEGTIRLRDEFTSRLGASASQLEKHGQRMQKVGRQMSDIGGQLTRTLTLPMVAVGGAAIKMATDLNEGMANVATLIPGNTARVAALRTEIQGLAVDVGKTTADLTSGLYQTISAFGDTADTVEVLEINARAATAGLSTTLEAIDLTSAVTKGYGDTSAEAVQKVADLALMTVRLGQTTFPELASSMGRVIPLAEAVGESQEQMFAVFATATGVVGGASEVATQYRGVINALLKPTADLSALIEEQGFASGEAMLRQLGLVDTLELIATTASSSGKPITDYIAQIEAVPLALALAGPQADVFREKLRQMGEAAGATDAAFREQTEGVNAAGFAWKQTRAEIEVALQQLGQELLPVATSFAKVLKPLVSGLSGVAKGLGALPEPARAVAVAFVGIVAAAGPALFITGQLITAWGALAASAPLVAARIAMVGGALRTLATGPVGLIATAAIAAASVVNEQFRRMAAESARDIDAMVRDIDKLKGALDDLRAAVRRGVVTDDEILAARRSLQPLTMELAEIERKLKFSSDRSDREGLFFRRDTIQSEIKMIEGWLAVAGRLPRINEEITVTAEGATGPPGGITGMTDALADAVDGIRGTIAANEAQIHAISESQERYAALNALLDEGVPLAAALSGAYDDLAQSLLQGSAELESWIKLREAEVEHAERVLELEREINRAYLDRAARAASPTSSPIPAPDLKQAEVDWSEFVEQIDQEWSEGMGRMSAELQAIQGQAWRNVQDIAADAIAEIIKTGELDFKSLFDSVLDVVAQMLAKMLIIWVANLAKRVAAEQAAAAASAAAWAAAGSGGGGGGTSMYGVDWWQVAGAASKGSGGGWWSSMFGSGVGGASWSTLGVMFGTAAAAVIIAELGNDWIQGQQQKLTAGTVSFGPEGASAFAANGELNTQMVAAMESLNDTFRQLEELTGASLAIVDQVEINVKGNGRIWVNIGDWFSREVASMEEALDLAVTQLVQRSDVIGGSPAVRAALESFAGGTIDELREAINLAMRSEELFLGTEGASAIRERTSEFFEILQHEIESGILEAQGGSGGLKGLVSTYQDSFDQLMGVQRDAAEQARMDARAHNAALQMDIARLQALKAEILVMGAATQAAGGFAETVGIGAKVMHAGTIATGGLAQATALSSRSQGAMAEVLLAGADAAGVNAEAQAALAGTQAAGAAVASAAAQANLAALQAIDEALALLAGLEVDIEAAAAAARRAGSGRGTRKSDLEQLRDLLDQMSFDRALAGMTELEAGRARLARQYEEEARRAHGNAELIAQLAEEYAFLNAELTRQIQLAAVDTFQSFLGIGEDPFSGLRDRWEEARRAVEEAGFGAERTARMLGRLDGAFRTMLDTLSREEFIGLGDTLFGILETYYGDVEGFEQFRIDVERMRFEAEMINARARFEILKAEGTIAAAVLARMQEVFDFIDSNPIDWGKFIAPTVGGGSGGAGGAADAARERENALRQLREIQARSLSPLMQAIRGVVDVFAELRQTLGWTAEVQAAYAQEIRRVLTEQLEPIKRLQEELAFRAGSSMRTIDQFRLAQRQANEAQAALAAGDLSQLDRIPGLVSRVLDLNPNAQAGEETRFLEAWAQQFLGQAQVLAEDAVTGIVPGSANDPFNWLRVTPTAGDDAVVAAIRDLADRQDRTTDAIKDGEEANEILRREERIRRSAETLNAAKAAERDAKRDALLGQIRDRVGASKQPPNRDAITLAGIR